MAIQHTPVNYSADGGGVHPDCCPQGAALDGVKEVFLNQNCRRQSICKENTQMSKVQRWIGTELEMQMLEADAG